MGPVKRASPSSSGRAVGPIWRQVGAVRAHLSPWEREGGLSSQRERRGRGCNRLWSSSSACLVWRPHPLPGLPPCDISIQQLGRGFRCHSRGKWASLWREGIWPAGLAPQWRYLPGQFQMLQGLTLHISPELSGGEPGEARTTKPFKASTFSPSLETQKL